LQDEETKAGGGWEGVSVGDEGREREGANEETTGRRDEIAGCC
jgi:hypothetical protein